MKCTLWIKLHKYSISGPIYWTTAWFPRCTSSPSFFIKGTNEHMASWQDKNIIMLACKSRRITGVSLFRGRMGLLQFTYRLKRSTTTLLLYVIGCFLFSELYNFENSRSTHQTPKRRRCRSSSNAVSLSWHTVPSVSLCPGEKVTISQAGTTPGLWTSLRSTTRLSTKLFCGTW